MSTPFTPGTDAPLLVGGIAVEAASAGAIVTPVPHGDVLAFTGVGPGTAVLGIAGLFSLIAGFFLLLFGKRMRPAGASDSPWADISHRADDVRGGGGSTPAG